MFYGSEVKTTLGLIILYIVIPKKEFYTRIPHPPSSPNVYNGTMTNRHLQVLL